MPVHLFQAKLNEYPEPCVLSPPLDSELLTLIHRTALMTEWIDAHTHLDSDELYPQRMQLLDRAAIAGVQKMMLVNSEATEESFQRTLECMRLPHRILRIASLGIHPHHAKDYSEALEKNLIRYLQENRVAALGEIGLDFYYDFSPRETQKSVLVRQLEIARNGNLTVVIHCRDAYEILADILSSITKNWKGMIHCFTGTPQEVQKLLDLGFHISFSGIVTFRTADQIRDAAKIVPSNRILIETDAPYLAPIPYRGKTNEPAFVAETGKFLARLLETPEEEFAVHLHQNFDNLFLDTNASDL